MAYSTLKTVLGLYTWALTPRTCGPLGWNDAADPLSTLLGDTPGSLGVNDYAVPQAKKEKKASMKRKTTQPQDYLTRAFSTASELRWIPYFKAAAEQFGKDDDSEASFSTATVLAVAYRETGLDPVYLKKAGDNGHGYGLMQMDIGSYANWIKSGKWMDAKECILKGAAILAEKRHVIREAENKATTVKTHKGEKYTFVGKEIGGRDLLRVAVAAYNCGLWSYYHYSEGHDVDRGTTGGNYSKEVMSNELRFSILLAASEWQPDFTPIVHPTGSRYA
jgi:hypothetical protein